MVVFISPKASLLSSAHTHYSLTRGMCRGNAVAVKVPNVQKFVTAEDKESFQQEVRNMANLFHPNIALFMGACTQEENVRVRM